MDELLHYQAEAAIRLVAEGAKRPQTPWTGY
jgi:hypothetical protein